MTDFQRSVWFNKEVRNSSLCKMGRLPPQSAHNLHPTALMSQVLDMYNDTSGFRNVKMIGAEEDIAQRRLMTHLTGSGCSVSLTHQESSASCKLSQSFGCYDGNNSMWTSNGCRGIFTCNGCVLTFPPSFFMVSQPRAATQSANHLAPPHTLTTQRGQCGLQR